LGLRAPAISIVLFIASFALYGCKKEEAKGPVWRAVNVRVAPAAKKAVRPFISAVAALKPDDEVTLSAEVSGALKTLSVDVGDKVSKGMTVASIDDTDYRLEVVRAEAALRQAEANLANTRIEFQRKETLRKEELVPAQQFDDVSTRLELSEAEVQRAKATLALAKQRLSKTALHAPISGSVSEKTVSAGDYVREGTALLRLIRTNPLKLVLSVTGADAGRLRTKQEVVFTVDAYPGRQFTGKISAIHPGLEETTRTLKAEALVPNPDGVLKPGLFADSVIYTGRPKDAVLIPATALLYDGEITKVFVVEGTAAKEKKVKIGAKYGELVEIIEGLKAGEIVVVVGQQNLSDGMTVNVAR